MDLPTLSAGFLAGVWAIASVTKAGRIDALTQQAALLVGRGLPQSSMRAFVLGEALLGAMFLIPSAIVSLLAGATSMAALITFSALMIWSRRHGRRISCGCFGPLLTSQNSPRHVTVNVLLALVSAAVILGSTGPASGAPVARLAAAAAVFAVSVTAFVTKPLAQAFMEMEV